MVGHEVNLLLGEHLVHGGDAFLPVVGEEHERPAPDPVYEKLDQVRTGHVAAAEDPLSVPAEEMRREDEGIASLGVQNRAEEAFRPVEDTVVVDDRIVPLAPFDGRKHHPEPVPLLDGLALVVPSDRVATGLEHDGAELPQAVVQRSDRVSEVFMELLVDLLQSHRIDNHREGGSGSVIVRRPDVQTFGRGKLTDKVEQLIVRFIEGQVMLGSCEGEQRIRMIDTDVKRVVGGLGLPKEPFQVLRSEVPVERFAVQAHLKLAVAVDLIQEVGELPTEVIHTGKEIPLDIEVTAGGVRRDLLRQDINDPV